MNENNICPGCGRHCHLDMPGCGRGEEIARSMGASGFDRPQPHGRPPMHDRKLAGDINEALTLNLMDAGRHAHALSHPHSGAAPAELFSVLSEEEKKTLLRLLERLNDDWEKRFKDEMSFEPPRHGGHGRNGFRFDVKKM